MKNKILFGIMALVMSVFVTGCSDDDDYVINQQPLLTDNSVVTGTADVTATSATFHGTVSGLENQAASAYTTGFNYGDAADNLTEKASAAGGAEFTATVAGSVGQTLYYQAYVTLQGKVTYKGEVKSTVLTNARATTGDATGIESNKATLAGTLADFPTEAESGIIVSGVEGTEQVRAGVRIAAPTAGSYTVEVDGLLPNTTYYYVAYLDLGAGMVYGDVKSFTTTTQHFDLDNDLVDLGLSTKWAKYNVGASSETEIGGLYGFGDLTGFNTSLDPADYASGDIYKTTRDIANRVFDGAVTMPTIAEFEELFSLCQKEWTEVNGVSGYKLTGPNGNSIFLPAAGSRTEGVTSGAGLEGYYLSGSVNASDNRFAMSYHFSSTLDTRTTTAVYQAAAVRPVSTAKNVPFDKELLYNTWEIDLTPDGSYQVFPGPTYFYGVDDSWRTVSNHEPIVGDSWSWEADFAGNSWAVGSADNCRGYMTFSKGEDGTNKVVVSQVTTEGTFIESEGTFSIDEENKTLTLDVEILAPANYVAPDYVTDKKTDIKILSLTKSSLQLAVLRTNDPCLLSINYVPQLEKYGYTAKLTCYGEGGSADDWASATMTIPGGEAGVGTYTLTFQAEAPRAYGQVYILDIVDYAAANPNAFIRVDALKADGEELKFDANKFYYGDIEGNGNYRIELANIWGMGHNDSWNGLKDTPFRQGGGEVVGETALAFQSTFEMTFTIVSLNADLAFTAKQTAVGLNEGWGMPGNWGKEYPGAIQVVKENCQYKLADTNDLPLTLTAAECDGGVAPANGVVNLVDIVGIRNYFPGFTADLVSVVNDGNNVPFDASKLIYGDIEGNGNYRIELHNIWGAGTAAAPAFGGITVVEGNNAATALGFSASSVYTIGNFSGNLFAVPEW